MGVREIDIRLLVWIEPGPGDGGHYHCVGGYYTVYYHLGVVRYSFKSIFDNRR